MCFTNGAEGGNRQEENQRNSQSMEGESAIEKCCENERGYGSAYDHCHSIETDPLRWVRGQGLNLSLSPLPIQKALGLFCAARMSKV